MKWDGVWTALVTPFRSGEIDHESLARLLRKQVESGVKGFVVNGTTGESPTIKAAERERLFKFVREKTSVPLMLGTGTNDTVTTIERTKEAETLGADAALVVVPYYNKPPQRGLAEHFRRVAESVSIPIFLYNVPGRTVAGLEVETIAELAKVPNIIGIKEATGDVAFAGRIAAACGPDFVLLSGDDGTYNAFLKVGGHGVISVAAHIIPEAFVHPENLPKYSRLIELLFSEANPIPVKKALQLVGLIDSAELRLPLVEMDSKKATDLEEEMKKCGLL